MAANAARARSVTPFTVRKRIALAVMVGVLAGALGQILHVTRTIEQVELATLNWRVQQTADPIPDDSDIVVVALDQATIDYVEAATSSEGRGYGWPWPRDVYLPFVSFCERAGAKVVVIDIFFIDPHKDGFERDAALAAGLAKCTIPIVMAAQGSQTQERARQGEQDYRQQLAIDRDSLQRPGDAGAPLMLLTDSSPLTPYRDLVERAPMSLRSEYFVTFAQVATTRVLDMSDSYVRSALKDYGPFLHSDAATGINPRYGSVDVVPEVDGIYRRYGALMAIDGNRRDRWLLDRAEPTSDGQPDDQTVAPLDAPGIEVSASVALRVLMELEGVDTVERVSDRELRVGSRVVPVDENGRMLLKFGQRQGARGEARDVESWRLRGDQSLFPIIQLAPILDAERREWKRRAIEDTFAVGLCNALLEADPTAADAQWAALIERAGLAMAEFETGVFDWYAELEEAVLARTGSPSVAFDSSAPCFAPLRATLGALHEDVVRGLPVSDPAAFATRVSHALIDLAAWFEFVNETTVTSRSGHLPLGVPLHVVQPLAALLAHAPDVAIGDGDPDRGTNEAAGDAGSRLRALERALRPEAIARMRELGAWPIDVDALATQPFDAARNGDLERALQGLQAEAVVAWSRWQNHVVDAYVTKARPKIGALASEQAAMASDALALLGDSDGDGDSENAALIAAARELATVRATALAALPEPTIDPSALKGKIVLLGATAAGLYDIRPNPVAPLGAGVDLHATAIHNILNDEHLQEAPDWLHVAIVFGLAIVAALLAFFLPGLTYALPVDLGLIGVYTLVALIAFDAGDLWLPWTAPVIGVVAGYAGASVAIYVAIGRDKRVLKGAMSQYMGKELVTVVEKHPELLKLGGDRRELSVYFSDVAGFTSISEKLAPEQLVVLLNRYLSSMTDIILGTGGIIDKYIGDAVMAVWGAPFDIDNHAAAACKAALACKRSLDKLRPILIAEGFPPLHARAGVNSGPAVAGNMGSDLRFSYTVMGDTVNLAARLEPWCKEVGAHVLIGERTYQLAQEHIEARLVDKLQAKGKEQAVPVYELIALKGELTESQAAMIEAHGAAFLYFLDRNWDKAMDLATDALRAEPDDEVSKHLMVRCMDYKQNPPPDNWDGRTIMRHK